LDIVYISTLAVLLFFYNRLFVGVPVIILALLVVMDDDIVVVGTRPTRDIALDAVALGTKTVVLPKAFI
jgi:hypothetical protein